ncbi:MAG: hypothetical protein ACI92G_002364 [Candidatus Pelagisphaera sp.]|jgi:hypothetical protein
MISSYGNSRPFLQVSLFFVPLCGKNQHGIVLLASLGDADLPFSIEAAIGIISNHSKTHPFRSI